MRRLMLGVLVCALLLLVFACGAALAQQRSREEFELVAPNAQEVQIQRTHVQRLQITYRLPANQSMHDVNRYLVSLGWRRIRARSEARSQSMSFVRTSTFGLVREFVIASPRAGDRRLIEMQVARCVQFRGWATCP